MSPQSALSAVLLDTTLEALHTADTPEAIIVGGGAAGGWAAMLLAESGMRVLVLDASMPPARFQTPVRKFAGRVVRKFSTPEGLRLLPPAFVPHARRALRMLGRWRQPI